MAPNTYDEEGCPEQELSPYNQAMNLLGQAIECVEHNLNTLRERLEPALSPQANPTPTTGSTKNHDQNAPITEGLHKLTNRVEEANSVIADIMERLVL